MAAGRWRDLCVGDGMSEDIGQPELAASVAIDEAADTELGPRRSPLHALHRARGGRMVAFADWSLPVQYATGLLAEHIQCRTRAALFDVSHMGQATLRGAGAIAALERLIPGDIAGLPDGHSRYSMLLNEAGGIIDDIVVTRLSADRLFLVINASRRNEDLAHLARALPPDVVVDPHEERALLALQGPAAAAAVARVFPDADKLRFMGAMETRFDDAPALVTRSGYTGEDGFEIALPPSRAEALAERLLRDPDVLPAGLGARDSLRLEAGLPLWGADIDELTSPIEAGLGFAVGKRRRVEGGFPGAALVADQIARGPHRKRVGIRPDGRAPARAGTVIAAIDGTAAGSVTSGGFGPTVGGPVSMGYVRRDLAAPGTAVTLLVRGRAVPATVTAMPFVPSRVHRASLHAVPPRDGATS